MLPTINKGKTQGGRGLRQKQTNKQTNKQTKKQTNKQTNKKTTAIVLLAVRDLPECNAHLDYELYLPVSLKYDFDEVSFWF